MTPVDLALAIAPYAGTVTIEVMPLGMEITARWHTAPDTTIQRTRRVSITHEELEHCRTSVVSTACQILRKEVTGE